MLKILPLKKWKVTFADGSYVIVDARTNWEAVKLAKPLSRFTTVHAALVIGWNRRMMRKNVAITSEMVKGAKGEGSKLLERLSKIDRNSSEARKIRRQLRKLGVSLSKAVSKEHLRKKVSEGERRRYIKKSLETPLMTKKQREKVLRKRLKEERDYRRGKKLGIGEGKHDQVLDTAEVLVKKVGYKSKPELVKRLMEIYPRLTEERAREIAYNVLIKKNPRKGLTSIRRELQLAKFRFKSMLPGHPHYKMVKNLIKELREQYHRLGGTRRYNPPAGATEIYGKILAIEAQKGPNSTFPKENFRHEFKPGSKIFGLPDGSILIKGKKKLWKKFKY